MTINKITMPKIMQVNTSDDKIYHVQIELLKTYSNFFDVMIDHEEEQEQAEEQNIKLEHIGHQAFDYIFQFLQLHKVKPPIKIQKPLIRGAALNTVMSEEDAELMERICALNTQTKVQVLNAVSYLRIQTFKTLLTYALMQKELQQPLTEMSADVTLEEEIKTEIQMRINSLIEMENHIKRLQAEDFKLSSNQDF